VVIRAIRGLNFCFRVQSLKLLANHLDDRSNNSSVPGTGLLAAWRGEQSAKFLIILDLSSQVHLTAFPPEASNACRPAKLLADYLHDRSNNLLTDQGQFYGFTVLGRDGGWANGTAD
jgi:hypothetical protein